MDWRIFGRIGKLGIRMFLVPEINLKYIYGMANPFPFFEYFIVDFFYLRICKSDHHKYNLGLHCGSTLGNYEN